MSRRIHLSEHSARIQLRPWTPKANIDFANRCYSTVKLPFPLTPQFKSMLQSGVGTRDLDVRWVSSLSWYFLTLFGLQPVYNFILGSNNGMYSRTYVLFGSS